MQKSADASSLTAASRGKEAREEAYRSWESMIDKRGPHACKRVRKECKKDFVCERRKSLSNQTDRHAYAYVVSHSPSTVDLAVKEERRQERGDRVCE